MTIVGFNFTNIHVHKDKPATGKINVSNNVSIKNVEETQLSMGQNKQNGLKFSFEFVSSYEPEVGAINLYGDVLTLEDEAKHKEILDGWKKNNSLDKSVMTPLLNHILQKCNVQALILSRDINLPPPVQLPKVSEKQK